MEQDRQFHCQTLGFLFLLILCILTAGCNQQAQGFALPEGDIEEGKLTFVGLSCDQCHSIGDIEWQGEADALDLHVPIGGKVTSIKSYGELVTSVINPSHKIAKRFQQITKTADGESRMENYNQVMTVEQLIDLVTFLQSEYQVEVPAAPQF